MEKHKKSIGTNKPSFLLYKDFDAQLQDLTDEQAGQYLKAIYAFQLDYDYEVTDAIVNFALKGAISQFKRDLHKYKDKVVKCSVAGRMSAEKRATSVNKRKQTPTNPTVEEEVEDVVVVTVEDKLLSLPAEAVEVTEKIIAHVQSLNPKQKNINPPKLDGTKLSWAIEIERMHRLDNRSWEEMRDMWDWILRDSFWCDKILSGQKFRNQFDTVYVKMQKSKPSAQELF